VVPVRQRGGVPRSLRDGAEHRALRPAAILKLVSGDPDGRADYMAVAGLSRGQATDRVVAESRSPIQPSDVRALARSMEARLEAGDPG